MGHDLTKEDLEGLLPSEREAIESTEDAEGAEEAVNDEASAAEDPADESAKSDQDEEPAAAEPAPETEAAKVEAAPTEDEEDDDEEPIVARFVADDEYKAARDALVAKFEAPESEMTLAQFMEEQDQLRQSAQERQLQEQVWVRSCRAFLKDNPHFKADTNPTLAGMLDSALKRVASDPENQNKSARWTLNEAARMVSKDIEAITGKPMAKQEVKPATPRPKAPDVTKTPKTLGSLPEAEMEEAGDEAGWIADLDRLQARDPMAYERALAKLSEEKVREYLGA